jgi:hypothetical protein
MALRWCVTEINLLFSKVTKLACKTVHLTKLLSYISQCHIYCKTLKRKSFCELASLPVKNGYNKSITTKCLFDAFMGTNFSVKVST